jgi:hypothetical protein
VDERPDEPRLAFVHVDDVPWTEVVAQQHGDRRVSVHPRLPNPTIAPPPGVTKGLGRSDRWS